MIQEQKTKTKPKSTASLRNMKIHFNVKFFCDNEMKLSMTVRDFNKLRKDAERINVGDDLANILQDAIQDRVPKGIGVNVESYQEGYKRY